MGSHNKKKNGLLQRGYSLFQIKLRFLDVQVNGRVQLDCMASGGAGTSNTKDGCM